MNLENTVAVIIESMGRAAPPQNVLSTELEKELEEKMLAKAKADSLKEQVSLQF